MRYGIAVLGCALVLSAQELTRQALQMFVYQQGFAAVEERYHLSLPGGIARFSFPIPSSAVEPQSLHLQLSSGHLQQLDYFAQLPTGEQLLKALRGQPVRFLSPDGQQVIEGRLTEVLTDHAVLRTPVGILLLPSPLSYRILLDSLPGTLQLRPALLATVASERSGTAQASLRYLLNGISWQMRYYVHLPDTGTQLRLQSYAFIHNGTEERFDHAQLWLVAGQPRRQPSPVFESAAALRAAEAKVAEAIPAETFGDYYRYELPQRVTLLPRQQLSVPVFDAVVSSVERLYRISTSSAHSGRLSAELTLRIPNATANGLGIPLPAGTVQAYSAAREQPGFLGESPLAQTPVGDTALIVLGRAFDIQALQRRREQRELSPTTVQLTYEILLENRRPAPATVELAFQVSEWNVVEWDIVRSSHPYRREEAQTAVFRTPLVGNSRETITFTLQLRRRP